MALAKKPFVVLDAEILSSSVWSEAAHVRLVWITLLILCDTDGDVGASVPGIASAAGVTLEQAQDALERLQAPDPYSRTKTNEGRRLEVVERGFRVLNFHEHLDRLSAERAKSRERVRKHRARYRNVTRPDISAQGKGTRDQGPEKRESVPLATIPVGRQESTDMPPDVKAEKRIRDSKVGDERRLLALVAEMERLDPKQRDAATLMQLVTSYDKPDGKRVGGCVNPATLSYERVQKSISDAETIIAGWKEQSRGPGQERPVQPTN